MAEWLVIALVVVVIATALAAVVIARKKRSETLRSDFGAEYDLVERESGNRRAAERELLARKSRHDDFDIRDLSDEERARFGQRWERVQARFVDEPTAAVAEADALVQEVMRTRGYPVDDFAQRSADLSVEHPEVVANYRAAHGISLAAAHGEATTEHLRQATIHYRALFAELAGPGPANEGSGPETVDLREESPCAIAERAGS